MTKRSNDKDGDEDPIDELFDNITKIFSSIFGIPLNTNKGRPNHLVDKNSSSEQKVIKHIHEKDEYIEVIYDIPGIDPSTVLLKVKDKKLYLYARNDKEIRDITELPHPVKDKIKNWEYRNGILIVTLEKKKKLFK